MKSFLQFLTLLLFVQTSTQAQNRGWKAEVMDRSFVQNDGQFEDINQKEVLFQTATVDFKVFFLKNEVVFEYAGVNQEFIEEQMELLAEKEREEEEGFEEEHGAIYPDKRRLVYQFKNTSQNLEVMGLEKQKHYYVFQEYPSIKAKTYKTLIYKNLYSNIDLVFYLPKEGGLKYEYIVHPYGNPQNIEVEFSKAFDVSLNDNNHLSFRFNDDLFKLQDKKPVAYLQNSEQEISVKYDLDKNHVSYDIGKYPSNQTLIIDPWVTLALPPLTDTTTALGFQERHFEFYDLESDFDGNVYGRVVPVGDIGLNIPVHVRKYDSNGNLLWIYNPAFRFSWDTYHWGDITINKNNGTLYFVSGREDFFISRISSTGVPQDSLEIMSNYGGFLEECLRLRYNHCNDSILMSEGMISTALLDRIGYLDTNLTAYLNLFEIGVSFVDVASFDFDFSGQFAYGNVSQNIGNEDSLYKVSINNNMSSSFINPIWSNHLGVNIEEAHVKSATFLQGFNNYNGTAAGFNYVYQYDGDSLVQVNTGNGAVNNVLSIASPNIAPAANKVAHTVIGGIDIDKCGRLFVNNFGEIQVYNDAMTQIATLATADDTLNDVEIGENELIYVAGRKYLEQIDYSNVVPLNQVFTTVPDSCALCVGSATVTPTNCSSLDSLDIFWPQTGQMGATATGLCEGWHVVELTGGCYSSLNVIRDSVYVINQNTSCILNIDILDDTICVGDCVDLVAMATGAYTAPITFQWDNGITSTDSMVNVCPATTTTYQVIGTDAMGEMDTATATITVLPIPVVDLGADTVVCGNSLLLDAGNPGSSYSWQDGSGNQTLNVTQSGIYWVDVDNGGCITRDSIDVTLNNVVVDLGPDTTICVGQSLTLDAGNTGATYSWQDGSTNQTFTANNAGWYWVDVTVGACVVRDSININQINLMVDLGPDTMVCTNSLLLDAGNPGTTYMWQDGSTNQTFNVTQTGTYWVDVNNSGCVVRDSINVAINNVMVDLGPDTTICVGQSLNLDAGNPGATYLWDDGSMNQTLNVTQSGTYWVQVSNNGCIDTDTINVIVQDLEVLFSASNTQGCEPLTVNFFMDLSTVAPGMITSWFWEFGDGNTSTQQNPTHTYNGSGDFNVTLTITTNNGCTQDSTATSFINVYPDPMANFSVDPTIAPIENPVFDFTNLSQGATSYLWDFGNGDTSTEEHPTYTYPGASGEYQVCLYVENQFGCTDSICNTVFVEEEFTLYVPNAFSPNGDGLNDVFTPVILGHNAECYQLQIFDRWGQQLFESTSDGESWSGNDSQSPDGVYKSDIYVWKITACPANSVETREYYGHVTLLK